MYLQFIAMLSHKKRDNDLPIVVGSLVNYPGPCTFTRGKVIGLPVYHCCPHENRQFGRDLGP